ncbi:uncharacterized protein LOC144820077 [Lissotriton helveticus]
MDSTQLCSFLLTVITGTVFPGHILGVLTVTENSFEQKILPPFVDGLNSLAYVADTVLTSTNLPQVIPNVRQLLDSSHQSLSEAEQSSALQVKSLSANVNSLSNNLNRLNNDKKMLQDKEQFLNVQLYGHRDQESVELKIAKKNLKNAIDGIDRAKKKWQDAHAERKKGIAMQIYPVPGPKLGAIMITKATEAIKQALEDANYAIAMRTKNTKTVESYESLYRNYENAIASTEQAIAANTQKIQVTETDLSSERAQHENFNAFLISLRKCTSFLSTGAGKTRVDNMYLDLSGVLDGVLGALNEITETLRPLVESSTEYSLLVTARLPNIIHKLEEANSRLKKAAAS